MIRVVLRTTLGGLVIATLIALAACEEAPGKAPDRDPDDPPAPRGPPDWAAVLSEHRVREATYALGYSLPDGRNYVIGTGFAAHYDNALWTNAHVAEGLLQELNDFAHLNPVAIAVRSDTPFGGSGTYRLIRFDVHPEYDGSTSSPDLASIDIEGEVPVVLELLPREHATQLLVGEPIGTVGFPGELYDPYETAPIATFKEGTISALRPYDGSVPTPANTTLVQHNLNLSGGTSGSLIIDKGGYVIAVNHAGVEAFAFDSNGRPVRVARGVIEFAIRVDEVWEMVDMFEQSGRGATTLRVATAARAE